MFNIRNNINKFSRKNLISYRISKIFNYLKNGTLKINGKKLFFSLNLEGAGGVKIRRAAK